MKPIWPPSPATWTGRNASLPASAQRQSHVVNLDGARRYGRLVQRKIAVTRPPPVFRLLHQPFPTLLKYIVRNIDNHMANWKVIALISGNIEAVSGPAAQDRPGAHEWIVWQGTAADKAEALQSAEKADPRVDLEWMRIRYERDLNKR